MKKLLFTLGLSSLFLLLLKPLSVYTLETYLTTLLETPVKVQDFKLFSLDLHAFITHPKNQVHIKVEKLYPLEATINYTGNIDAFKRYHPLKSFATLSAKLSYTQHLNIVGELQTLGAVSKVSVGEDKEDWWVKAKIKHLDLAKIKNENNISISMFGKVNAEIDFHTQKDSFIKLDSQEIRVHEQIFNNVKIDIKDIESHIQSFTIFEAPNIEYKGIWLNYYENNNSFDGEIDLKVKNVNNDIKLRLSGEHNSTILQAKLDVTIAKSKISIENIVYNLKTNEASAGIDINLKEMQKHTSLLKLLGLKLKGDLDATANFHYLNEELKADLLTKSLGGELKLIFDKELTWKAKEVSLKKLAHIFSLNQDIRGKINSSGSFLNEKVNTTLSSESIIVEKTEFSDIEIKVNGKIQNLIGEVKLKSPYANLETTHFKIKDLDSVVLTSSLTTPYTKEEINLELNATYKNEVLLVHLQSLSKEFSINALDAQYIKGELKGKYKLELDKSLSKLKKKLSLKGHFSYKDRLRAFAETKDFSGRISANIEGSNLHLIARKVQLQSILSQLNQPQYAQGKLDFEVKGTLEKLDFDLKSKNIHFNKKETGLDENVSLVIKGHLDEKGIYLWPKVKNKHLELATGVVFFNPKNKKLSSKLFFDIKDKNNSLDLVLDTKLSLKEGAVGEINLIHNKDYFSLKNFNYRNKDLNTELALKVKNLNIYRSLIQQELYGRLKIDGSIQRINEKNKVELMTKSFGGKVKFSLQNNNINLELKNLSVDKLGDMLKGQELESKGSLNGFLTYNIKTNTGDLETTIKDAELRGIDIDKSLQEVQDILGLNIFAMGNSLLKKRVFKKQDLQLRTHLMHTQFDVHITPEFIISKDIALATKTNRFAINAKLKVNGDIEELEIAILDLQGCAVLRQKLQGNIKDPELVNTKATAVVVLGQAPKAILKTGGKIVDAGSGLLDKAATFIWKQGLKQDSKVTLVDDILAKGSNIFSTGKSMVVSGECTIFYKGKVQSPKESSK